MSTPTAEDIEELPEVWEEAITKATSLMRQACLQAVRRNGYGEIAARIPANGPKGPGREIAEFKETFV